MENKVSANKLASSQTISLILTLCSISVVFIYLIYSNNFVFGSAAGSWIYPYYKNIALIPYWIPITVLFLTGVMIYGGSRLIQNHEKATLIGCFIIAILIQVLLQEISQNGLDQLIKSDVTTSFYTSALRYSPEQLLSQFQTLVPELPLHSQSNMPGKILFFQLLTIFTSSPQVMGYMIISISTLGGLILYGISKRLFHDHLVAFYSFILYILIPCKQIFFPILNTVTPVFILICIYLFLIYLDSKNKLHLILLGISLYVLALFEPSPFVTGLLFVGILLHAIGQKKVLLKELIPIMLVPTLSFVAIYTLFILFFSFNLWQVLNTLIKDAMVFNAKHYRSYLVWLKENVKEFFYAVGLPTIMIFIYFVISIFSQWKMLAKNILHWSIENIYVVSLILTFSVVLFLGINRGETTRLWIYLAVFFQIPVAFFMAKVVKNNTLMFMVAGMLIAQTIMTLQRVRFLAP